MTDPEIRPHPATFSKKVLAAIRQVLMPEAVAVGHLKVLDPFAGRGGVHELAESAISTVGVELEPEWAHAHADTLVGSVLDLPRAPDGCDWSARFDALVTSPCYGNRMADHHEAKDRCRACGGSGVVAASDDMEAGAGAGSPGEKCRTCKGSGLTMRNTYRHQLGRMPSDGSSTVMPWGPRYRAFHEDAWRATRRCLAPGALVVLNVKNPLETNQRTGDVTEHRVVEFHVNTWLMMGCTLQEVRRVATKGLPYGANHDVRTEAELVCVLRVPR